MPLQLGCLPALRDARNIQMGALLEPMAAIAVPEEYDFDYAHPDIPLPMYANDQYGCCVITSRAHQTLRFEESEQDRILPITDTDVIKQWKRENGNTENGLYILESLKLWRKEGWTAAGQQYRIQAFAEVQPTNHLEVQATIFNNIGLVCGLALPDNWQVEYTAGRPWRDTSNPQNPRSGHCVYLSGYTHVGPVCVTWGKKQQMTWQWWDRYCAEAYAVIDAKNPSINGVLLAHLLAKLGIEL